MLMNIRTVVPFLLIIQIRLSSLFSGLRYELNQNSNPNNFEVNEMSPSHSKHFKFYSKHISCTLLSRTMLLLAFDSIKGIPDTKTI